MPSQRMPPCEPDTPGTGTLQPSPGLNQHASMTSWGVAGPGRQEPQFTEAAELAPPGCADEGKTLRLRCVRNLHEMCATLEKEPMFVSRSALQRVRKLRDRFLKTWSLLHQRTLSQGSGLTQPHRRPNLPHVSAVRPISRTGHARSTALRLPGC